MSWDVSLRQHDGEPLGSIDFLRTTFTECLAAVQFDWDPSGREKMVATGIAFPEVIRKFLENHPARIQADFEGDDVHLRFFFGPEDQTEIMRVDVEVRGSGNQIPPLSAVCSRNGWKAEGPDGCELDLSAGSSKEWDEFESWRDRTVAALK
jgi:hypothetical protein